MCRLKRWPPKSPWRIYSQEPRPRKVVRFGPRFGPRKAVPFGSRIWAPKRAPIRAPKSRIPFGSRIRAPKRCSIWAPGSSSKLVSSWKNYSCWLRRLFQNVGRVQAPKLPQREQGTVAQWQRARTNLRIQIPLAPIFCAE